MGSRAAHAAAARAAGATYLELDGPLDLDLDTPDDLLAAEAAGLGPASGRSARERPGRARRPGRRSSPHDRATRSWSCRSRRLPEVRPGDDLAASSADALAATPGALPLRADDVIVVTQKVVSKAEGAIVDLRTIEPRPEAVAFAARWKRDPRQVEVVLREAVRVVRMANGVIIAETRHGFVLANAGVDASNVGPGSGDVVLLLPDDPDASARRIRDGLEARFGRRARAWSSPTAWGGPGASASPTSRSAWPASGRSRTCGARPTPTGALMAATVRAVADEIASAAELVLGKAARRPAALVRGASPPPGDGSVRARRPHAARDRPLPLSPRPLAGGDAGRGRGRRRPWAGAHAGRGPGQTPAVAGADAGRGPGQTPAVGRGRRRPGPGQTPAVVGIPGHGLEGSLPEMPRSHAWQAQSRHRPSRMRSSHAVAACRPRTCHP